MFQTRKEKDFEEFVRALPKLEPIEFYGLAKILSTEKMKGETELDVVLEHMMDRFLELPKRRRREILGMLRDVKREVKQNGSTT